MSNNDFSPIGNFWHIMNPKITVKKFASTIESQESIPRVWFHDIGQNYIQKLIFSMSDCFKAAIAAGGGSTEY